MSVEWLIAAAIGVVAGAGVFMLFVPNTFSTALGLSLLSYAVNFLIFAAGRLWVGVPPIVGTSERVADPLPQALILTAIVIGFATTAYLLVLAVRLFRETGEDGRGFDPSERS